MTSVHQLGSSIHMLADRGDLHIVTCSRCHIVMRAGDTSRIKVSGWD